jgi:hypothetical protein
MRARAAFCFSCWFLGCGSGCGVVFLFPKPTPPPRPLHKLTPQKQPVNAPQTQQTQQKQNKNSELADSNPRLLVDVGRVVETQEALDAAARATRAAFGARALGFVFCSLQQAFLWGRQSFSYLLSSRKNTIDHAPPPKKTPKQNQKHQNSQAAPLPRAAAGRAGGGGARARGAVAGALRELRQAQRAGAFLFGGGGGWPGAAFLF